MGSRRNIFSVKWAPASGSNKLFACAGDAQVRVFDISRTSAASTSKSAGRTWQSFSPDAACVRVFRCHKNRAKRVATEDSPDVFLTCSLLPVALVVQVLNSTTGSEDGSKLHTECDIRHAHILSQALFDNMI